MFPTADTEDIVQVTSQKRNTGVTSDEQDSPENTKIAKQQNNRELTLNMLVKEMVFCIALALTTYGALHNTPTKVSKHPQAERFFSPDSLVTDWYKGQLNAALYVINSADVSFVMYYAPWDAESQYVRGEIEKAASILSDRVHFSAINCWNPGSECRLQHNKIPSWPILMAYTVTSRGVLYDGPRNAQSIVKFLELVMNPLVRVSSTKELINLLSVCEAVAVGFTPLTETSKYYNIWYYVALKVRDYDSIGEICLAAVTSQDLAAELGVETVPNARLMLWNDKKEYSTVENMRPWNETSLLQWVLENFTQPVARIIPMWKKAFSFEKYADGNPILLLFTPLNPLYEQLPSYTLLREIAMEYHNCNRSETSISGLIKIQKVQRLLYQQNDLKKYCQEFKFRKSVRKRNKHYKKEVISQNNKYPWNNTTQRNQNNGDINFLLRRNLVIAQAIASMDDESDMVSTTALLQECGSNVMPAEKGFYNFYDKCEKYEESYPMDQESENEEESVKTSMLPLEDDPLAPENMVQENVKHFCKLFKLANEFGPPVAPPTVAGGEKNISHIEGLACQRNFSLHMIAVDSVRNHHFAEFLGVDITKMKDKTAVIILDSKLETQYVLSEEYSAKSVRDFIFNYTTNRLKRSLRTHVDDASHTHYFGSDGLPVNDINHTVVSIEELTTKSFRKTVRTPGIVSLVAICGGACGSSVSRALTEAARVLRACGVRARAARLDALRHDLPWPYTAPHYPTVLVFPGRRGRAGGTGNAEWAGGAVDSRPLPASARVSASALVALAVRALGPSHHLRLRLLLCGKAPMTFEKNTCLKELREHVTIVIARNLKYWRRTERRELKDAFFKRLQHLHRISLDLSILYVTDLNEDSDKLRKLLDSINRLTIDWDVDVSIIGVNGSKS